MDLPWNPAVLEQRVGRVHRLGQTQPVRVVNFVAQGTIEEGMLSVLRFKKSLFAGVLDGGETEVFLGGSRLNKFMETVESTTKAIPDAMAEDAAPEPASRAASDSASRVASAPGVEAQESPTPADPWAGLLQTGMALLQQFAARPTTGGGLASLVKRDEHTGETYLKVPVVKPEVLDQALKAFETLLQGLRG
jgi:hypothetical protein